MLSREKDVVMEKNVVKATNSCQGKMMLSWEKDVVKATRKCQGKKMLSR